VAWLNEAFAVQEKLISTNHKTFKAGFQQSPAFSHLTTSGSHGTWHEKITWFK